MIIFNKTCIGYSHINNNTNCQDCSDSFTSTDRSIIATCDGHGSKIHFRSELGSKYAVKAIMKVFKSLDIKTIEYEEDYLNQLKIKILCEWNDLVFANLKNNPISEEDLENFNENDRNILKENPIIAYGSTLIGAMVTDEYTIVVQLGDGESMFLVNDGVELCFDEEEDEEPVGNLTYSLCQEKASDYMKVCICKTKSINGLLICTDGVINPYQNLENFKTHFYDNLIKKVIETNDTKILSNFIKELGINKGIGDDVSIGLIAKELDKEVKIDELNSSDSDNKPKE